MSGTGFGKGLLVAVALAAVVLAFAPAPADAQSNETEGRIAARRLSDGRIEFALQLRSGSEWGERILPQRRYFPASSQLRWLTSSAVAADGAEVRIAARRLADGRVEFALQPRGESGWGERILPSRRYFPASSHDRWLHSSPVVVAGMDADASGQDELPLPAMLFADSIRTERRAEISELVKKVLRFYSDRYGIAPPDFSIHIGVDTDPGIGAYTQGDAIYVGWHFVDSDTLGTALAHEYFHILAQHLQRLPAGEADSSPAWLIEGTATYAGDVYEEANKIRTWDQIRSSWIWESAVLPVSLSSMESWREFQQWGFVSYHLAALATEWLVNYAGDNSYIEYWLLLADAEWPSAFEAAFGLSTDEFYRVFTRDHERELASTFDWMLGTVIGPEDDPIGDAELWAHPAGGGRSRFGRTGMDGSFGLAVPGGSYTIGVYRRPTGAWEVVGWYGVGGFTTARDRATAIVLDGANVTGIEIRLPAALVDLPSIP